MVSLYSVDSLICAIALWMRPPECTEPGDLRLANLWPGFRRTSHFGARFRKCQPREQVLVRLTLRFKADMDRDKCRTGKKPLAAQDGERPSPYFSKRLKQGVVRTR
jgi:hypothetical protein